MYATDARLLPELVDGGNLLALAEQSATMPGLCVSPKKEVIRCPLHGGPPVPACL